jgi:hypothetical protein
MIKKIVNCQTSLIQISNWGIHKTTNSLSLKVVDNHIKVRTYIGIHEISYAIVLGQGATLRIYDRQKFGDASGIVSKTAAFLGNAETLETFRMCFF